MSPGLSYALNSFLKQCKQAAEHAGNIIGNYHNCELPTDVYERHCVFWSFYKPENSLCSALASGIVILDRHSAPADSPTAIQTPTADIDLVYTAMYSESNTV